VFEPFVSFADPFARQAMLLKALEETTGEAEDMIVEYILVCGCFVVGWLVYVLLFILILCFGFHLCCFPWNQVMVENGRTMSSMSAELSTFIAAEHAQELIAR
jgi:hypothetical protein